MCKLARYRLNACYYKFFFLMLPPRVQMLANAYIPKLLWLQHTCQISPLFVWEQNNSCTVAWLQWPTLHLGQQGHWMLITRRKTSFTNLHPWVPAQFYHKVSVELQRPNWSTSTLPRMSEPCYHIKLQLRIDVSSSGKDLWGAMVWTNTL
jgi:hypothetical protein